MRMRTKSITLEEINENIIGLKREMDEIKGFLEEDRLDLSAEVKSRIEESRKRPISEFKTQEEIEKKFL